MSINLKKRIIAFYNEKEEVLGQCLFSEDFFKNTDKVYPFVSLEKSGDAIICAWTQNDSNSKWNYYA